MRSGVQRYQGIQVARGIAAFLVVLQHSKISIKYFDFPFWQENSNSFSLLDHMYFGVDVFFCISGFIMCMLCSNKKSGIRYGASFLIDRAVRIYPPYWIATAFVVFAFYASHQQLNMGHMTGLDTENAIHVIKSALLIPDETTPVLGVGWTLVLEMQFYLICAVALCCSMGASLVIIISLFAVVGIVLDLDGASLLNGHFLSPFNFEFLLGAIIFQKRELISKLDVRFVAIVAAMAFSGTCYIMDRYGFNDLSPARYIGFGIAAMCLTSFCYIAFREVAPRALVTLGDISYSLYLTHWFFLSATGKVGARFHSMGTGVQILWWLGSIMGAVASGYVLARYVELPSHVFAQKTSRAFLNRFWRAKTPPIAA